MLLGNDNKFNLSIYLTPDIHLSMSIRLVRKYFETASSNSLSISIEGTCRLVCSLMYRWHPCALPYLWNCHWTQGSLLAFTHICSLNFAIFVSIEVLMKSIRCADTIKGGSMLEQLLCALRWASWHKLNSCRLSNSSWSRGARILAALCAELQLIDPVFVRLYRPAHSCKKLA